MALESASYIDGLVPANPSSTDSVSQADDHLRLLKSVIKNTFPNITGPLTVTQAQLNNITSYAPLASPAFTGTPTVPTAASGTSNNQVASTAFVQASLQAVYPIGSIYINATNSANPSSLLGFGTWVAFGAGRVPVGFNASDPLFDSAEETGGSKDAIVVSHTHTATSTVTDPGHTHNTSKPVMTNALGGNGAGGFDRLLETISTTSSTTGITVTTTNASTGSSGTNANLQPYITVYMWKRTA